MDYTERGPSDCWEWNGKGKPPNDKARMACLNPNCCNPRHVVVKPKRKAARNK